MSPALALVLAALAPAATSRAPAGEVTAAGHAEPTEPDPAVRAGELFERGEFEQAAAAFAEAYARTGDPALLFGRAQALRRAGDCGGAIAVFEAFIASSPPEPDVQAARDVIAACRSILGEDAVEPEVDAPEPEPAPPAGPVSPPPPRWPRDVTGGVLLGSGLAVAVTGAALYGTAFARAADRSGDPMEGEQAFEARERSVRTLAAVGGGLMLGGTALLVGSVVRYAIVARRDRSRGDVARRRAALARRFGS